MALRQLCGYECSGIVSQECIIIDDISNSLSVGDTISVSGCTSNSENLTPFANQICTEICFVIKSIKDTSDPANVILLNNYGPNNCQTCISSEYQYVQINRCFSDEQWTMSVSEFSSPPSIGDVFNLSFYVGYFGFVEQVSGCFEINRFTFLVPDTLPVITSSELKTSCQDCLDTSPVIYEVIECVSQDTYYIAFPSTGYEDHLITFTDLSELTQFCGFVKGVSNTSINGIFVTDLGVVSRQNNCDSCLSNVAEKKKIVDCLDPMNFEIVWASTLLTVGTATHLSTPGGGCFTISEDIVDPSEPVTLNEFADFRPQEECEDCLECYGLEYEFQSCEQLEIFAPSNVIDTSSNSLYCNKGIAIDSSNIAYVVNDCALTIGKIDLSTQTILETQSLSYSPRHLAINETDGVICVANGTNIVTFVNLSDLSQSQSSTINVFLNNPSSVYFDPIDSLFYITYDNCCGAQSIEVWSGSAYNSMSYVTSFGSTDGYKGIVRVGSSLYMLRSTNTLEVYGIVSPGSYVSLTSYSLPTFPTSIDYDGINSLYMGYYGSYLIWNISSPGYNLYSFPNNCGGGLQSIKVNNSTDRIFITDYSCNYIYEIQKSTNTFLREYNLSNYSYSNFYQPFGIANDNLGNIWFTSYDDVFTLGSTTDFVTGITTSSEYLSAGTIFFNYILSACCEIRSVTPIVTEDIIFDRDYYSMVSYSSCETCTGVTHTTWVCRICDFSFGDFELTLVDPLGIYNIGDVVKVHQGNSNFVCAEIIGLYDLSYGFLPSFDSQGEPSFSSCTECNNGGTVGLTIVNCDTLVPQTINVTISEYLQIFGFPPNVPQTVISDVNGVCYQVANTCPIETTSPLFEISNFYINQTFCRLGNRGIPAPTSAGTEYFVCQICCPCGTGTTITSVSVPHPVWTGIQGNSVTLLDMVQLGGMNGLNC